MKKAFAAMLVLLIFWMGSDAGTAKTPEKVTPGGNDKYIEMIPEEDARQADAQGAHDRVHEKDANKNIPEGERKLIERLNRARAMSDTLAQ